MNRLVFWAGVATVLVVTFSHYLTPSSSPQLHDALRRLYYLPIVLVAIKCGIKAGLIVASLSVVTYLPHIWTHWGGHPMGAGNLNRTFEMLMWLAVATLAGILAKRERSARELAEAARREAEAARDAAEDSTRDARTAARSLLEAEDRLRHADRLATLGFLSASLAHEVRNPLGSLRGIADMLYREFPEGHARRELVDILDEEVRRLDGVVTNYLEHARPAPGGGPAMVKDGAEAVLRLLKSDLTKKSIGVEVDVEPAGLATPLPMDFLRQVLLNLVLNSMNAIGTKGGHIWIRGRSCDSGDTIIVEDDGPGFPDALLVEDRRSFFSSHRHGSGLGLPIVHQIVDSHGGRLTLENRPHGGGRATITVGGERRE